MDMTNQEYNQYVKSLAQPSPLWKDLVSGKKPFTL